MILLKGRSYIGLLFVAPLVADLLVRGMPLPLWAEALAVVVVGCGYAAATLFLLRPKLRLDPTLSTLRDLSWLLLVAGASTAVVALAYASIFVLTGLLAREQYLAAALQPLTAMGNYARLVRDMLSSGEGHTVATLETSKKAVAQVEHAARLIRHFREFVRTGNHFPGAFVTISLPSAPEMGHAT